MAILEEFSVFLSKDFVLEEDISNIDFLKLAKVHRFDNIVAFVEESMICDRGIDLMSKFKVLKKYSQQIDLSILKRIIEARNGFYLTQTESDFQAGGRIDFDVNKLITHNFQIFELDNSYMDVYTKAGNFYGLSSLMHTFKPINNANDMHKYKLIDTDWDSPTPGLVPDTYVPEYLVCSPEIHQVEVMRQSLLHKLDYLNRQFGIYPLYSGGPSDSEFTLMKKGANEDIRDITAQDLDFGIYPEVVHKFIINIYFNSMIKDIVFSHEKQY